MRAFRKATIREVASRAGVSTTTVSLFVGGREAVCSSETAQRIRQAVEELNYTPNSLTRGLRSKSQTTLGVCLASPMDPEVRFGAFFLESMWRGIIAQADEDNYCLLHYPARLRIDGPHSGLLDGRVDGILLLDHSRPKAKALVSAGMPTVVLASALDLPIGCGAAYADDRGTSLLAIEHLWQLGHRRIAHVAGPVGWRASAHLTAKHKSDSCGDDVALERLDGYIELMTERCAFDPDLIAYPQAWDEANLTGDFARWRAMRNPPTAVYCVNDAIAATAVSAARSLGMSVPEDMSIVGVDDSEVARSLGLTSVVVPIYAVGRAGVTAVLSLISGLPIDQCRIQVPVTELVARASTAPLIH